MLFTYAVVAASVELSVVVGVGTVTVPVNVGLDFKAYVDDAVALVKYDPNALDIVVVKSDIFELVILNYLLSNHRLVDMLLKL